MIEMSQNYGQEYKQAQEQKFGESGQTNQGLDVYARPQKEGAEKFARKITQVPSGDLSFDKLAQIFSGLDPTALQAFVASTAYGLYENPDDSVQTRTAKALRDTEGAKLFNGQVAQLHPSKELVEFIGAAILKKVANKNAEIAQATTTPNNEDPSEEDEIRERIADFIAMKLAMHQESVNPSNTVGGPWGPPGCNDC